MIFTKLKLENWRNFTHVEAALQERMFLVGPNASGKSNLLDVFRFLRDLVQVGGGIQKAVADRDGVSRLRCLAARRYSDLVIEVCLRDGKNEVWGYRLALNQDNQRRPIIKEEKVWKSGQLLLQRPNQEDQRDQERLRQTYLEQVNANREFREVADFFATIHYYHIGPQLIRDPERLVGRPVAQRFDPYGGDFLGWIS